MIPKKITKAKPIKKPKPDLESAKMLLKKSELQTSILKKIINQHKPTDK
jgi:hypothetical protein